MTEPVGGVLLVEPDRRHHVEALGDQPGDHRPCARRVVGGVAIDQHVDVGLDIGEHPAHHVALALVRLTAHVRAGCPRNLGRAIARVVVVDVDGGMRQRRPEAPDDVGNGGFLVVAGHEDHDPIAAGNVRRLGRVGCLSGLQHRPSLARMAAATSALAAPTTHFYARDLNVPSPIRCENRRVGTALRRWPENRVVFKSLT